jgi:hypothetical protein
MGKSLLRRILLMLENPSARQIRCAYFSRVIPQCPKRQAAAFSLRGRPMKSEHSSGPSPATESHTSRAPRGTRGRFLAAVHTASSRLELCLSPLTGGRRPEPCLDQAVSSHACTRPIKPRLQVLYRSFKRIYLVDAVHPLESALDRCRLVCAGLKAALAWHRTKYLIPLSRPGAQTHAIWLH